MTRSKEDVSWYTSLDAEFIFIYIIPVVLTDVVELKQTDLNHVDCARSLLRHLSLSLWCFKPAPIDIGEVHCFDWAIAYLLTTFLAWEGWTTMRRFNAKNHTNCSRPPQSHPLSHQLVKVVWVHCCCSRPLNLSLCNHLTITSHNYLQVEKQRRCGVACSDKRLLRAIAGEVRSGPHRSISPGPPIFVLRRLHIYSLIMF